MFPPDANIPSHQPLLPDVDAKSFPIGEPKSIRYHATRLNQVAKERSSASANDSTSSSAGGSSVRGGSSPSRSRVNAAISGTPCAFRSTLSSALQCNNWSDLLSPSFVLDPNPSHATPRVSGFSFVDALPSPRASTISAAALQELMTWGTIDSTPIALRSSSSSAFPTALSDIAGNYTAAGAQRSALGGGGGPFRVAEIGRRERLALQMAGRSENRASAAFGLTTPASTTTAGSRSASKRSLSSSSQQQYMNSPRTRSLTPAAQQLLGRTHRSGTKQGMSSTQEYAASAREEEIKLRLVREKERAKAKAREMQGMEKLRRETWGESPDTSMGSDSIL